MAQQKGGPMKRTALFPFFSLFFVACALFIFSGSAASQNCTPNYSHASDDTGSCPSLYKRSNWLITVSSGSQGEVRIPFITSGQGGCGYQTACGNVFTGWLECWPAFYTPTTSRGCWRQTVVNYSANCQGIACGESSAQNACSCNSTGTTLFSISVNAAYCGGC